MARTVKTTPWWARMAASPDALANEVHDHRNGVCNLPDGPGDLNNIWWPRDGDCGWVPSNRLYYGPGHGCGCWMCTDQVGRKSRARRNRQRDKVLSRQLRKGLWAGEEPDDIC